MSKWCIDPNAEVVPDQTYDESDAAADPLGPEETYDDSQPEALDTLYGAPGAGEDYGAPLDLDEYGEDAFSNDLPPPPPPRDSFEQAESSYNRYTGTVV